MLALYFSEIYFSGILDSRVAMAMRRILRVLADRILDRIFDRLESPFFFERYCLYCRDPRPVVGTPSLRYVQAKAVFTVPISLRARHHQIIAQEFTYDGPLRGLTQIYSDNILGVNRRRKNKSPAMAQVGICARRMNARSTIVSVDGPRSTFLGVQREALRRGINQAQRPRWKPS